MSLRWKTFLGVSLSLAALTGLLLVLLTSILSSGFERVERAHARAAAGRAAAALQDANQQLGTNAEDWARWTDLHRYMTGRDPGFPATNLSAAAFRTLNLHLVAVLDVRGKPVRAFHVNLEGKVSRPPAGLWRHLRPGRPLYTHPLLLRETDGILLLEDGAYLVSARTITDQVVQAPSAGTLIFGRRLDRAALARLSFVTRTPLHIERVDRPIEDPGFQVARQGLARSGETFFQPRGANRAHVYTLQPDVDGQPGIMLRAELDRPIWVQGQRTLSTVLLALLVASLLLGIVLLLLMDRGVLGRVRRLEQAVDAIQASEDPSLAVPEAGNDELSRLGQAINEMVRSIRAAQERRRASEHHFAVVAVQTSEGLMVADRRTGRVVEANPAIRRLLGYDVSELRHYTVSDLFLLSDAECARNLTAGRFRGECVAKRRDGALLDVEVTADGIEHEGSEAISLVVRDITERKQAQKALESARRSAEEANRAKGEFLANVSHEMRTPLNGILGMTDLALETDLSDTQREFLSHIRGSATSLMQAINNVLDFSKIEAGHLELDEIPFDLSERLEEVLEMVAHDAYRKGLELVGEVDEDVPAMVVADPTRLGQVLLNLVANAVKFTARGQVLVRVERDRSAPTVEGRVPLRFLVQDTGVGIAPEKQSVIFEPFRQGDGSTTRQYGGTGLGLAICSRLVNQMGGRLTVHSRPGEGSRFEFTLRMVGGPAVPRPEPLSGDGEDVPVLLAVPNEDLRRTLARTLRSEGFRVREAGSFAGVGDLLNEAAEQQRPYRLALVDASLRTVADGRAASELRDQPGLGGPVIALAPPTDNEALRPQEGDGSRLLVTKPVRYRKLRAALREALSLPRVLPPPAAPAVRLLVVDGSPTGRTLAQRVLAQGSYDLVVVDSAAAALDQIRHGSRQFDAALVDLELPAPGGYDLARQIRAAANGHAPRLLALCGSRARLDAALLREAGFEGCLPKPLDLSALERTLKVD